jgi:hypothetical protein
MVGNMKSPLSPPPRTQTQEKCLQLSVESPKLGRSHTAWLGGSKRRCRRGGTNAAQ